MFKNKSNWSHNVPLSDIADGNHHAITLLQDEFGSDPVQVAINEDLYATLACYDDEMRLPINGDDMRLCLLLNEDGVSTGVYRLDMGHGPDFIARQTQ